MRWPRTSIRTYGIESIRYMRLCHIIRVQIVCEMMVRGFMLMACDVCVHPPGRFRHAYVIYIGHVVWVFVVFVWRFELRHDTNQLPGRGSICTLW